MKTETSSLDLHYLVEEMQFLIGGKIDKIYQDNKNLLLVLHVPSKGKQLLTVIAPNYFFIASKKQEFPQTPAGFCMFLRKYLGNTRLRSIQQHGFERIVKLEFESKESTYIMIIELFSKGNLILCKEDYTIMSALESHKWKERTVRGGVKYEFPERKYNPIILTEKELRKAFDESEKESVVKFLAMELGFGGIYSEQICKNADIDKSSTKLSDDKINDILKEIKNIINKKPEPIVTESGEAYPFSISTNEGTRFETLNNAIDSIITPTLSIKKSEEAKSKHNKKLDKAKDIIKRQEKQISEMEKAYLEHQRKGELIYENYTELKDILDTIKKAREKYSWGEIKEKLKGHEIIKEINEKESKITLELKKE